MRLRARARRQRVRDEPSSKIRPDRGVRAPEINFSRVDLPLAFGRGWRRFHRAGPETCGFQREKRGWAGLPCGRN